MTPRARAAVALALAAAVSACASSEKVNPHIGLPLGMTHVSPSERPPMRRPTPPALTRLAATVHTLDAGAHDLDHQRLVQALRELADAVAVLAPSRTPEIDAIRRAAIELETSPPGSLMHTDYALYGLRGALAALAASTPYDTADTREYRRWVHALAVALEPVEDDRALLTQHAHLVEAFRTATRTLYVLADVEPPHALVSEAPRAAEPVSAE